MESAATPIDLDVPFIAVRMYTVGFGDCFLVRFCGFDCDHTVLVDCGTYPGGTDGAVLDRVVERVVGDVEDLVGRRRIDVVVATHRHRDHVEGFASPIWAGVDVGEVWMPWCENLEDTAGRRLVERQVARALQLRRLHQGQTDATSARVLALAENCIPNERAMATLRYGFAGSPRRCYLGAAPPGESSLLTTAVLPGVTVYVLAPASDGPEIEAIQPPPKTYHVGGGPYSPFLTPAGANLPFERFLVSQVEFRQRYPHLIARNLGDVVTAGRSSPVAMAAALQQAVDATSLVLAFEYRGATLLLAGDAPATAWRTALEDQDRRAVLERVDLYKLSQHGSASGTPDEFLRLHKRPTVALVSTGAAAGADEAEIPAPRLMTALQESGVSVVRSDAAPIEGMSEITTAADGGWTEVRMPSPA